MRSPDANIGTDVEPTLSPGVQESTIQFSMEAATYFPRESEREEESVIVEVSFVPVEPLISSEAFFILRQIPSQKRLGQTTRRSQWRVFMWSRSMCRKPVRLSFQHLPLCPRHFVPAASIFRQQVLPRQLAWLCPSAPRRKFLPK